MPSQVVDFDSSFVVLFLKLFILRLQFFVLLIAGFSFLLELGDFIVAAFQLISQQLHLFLVSDVFDSEALVGAAHHWRQIGRSDPAYLVVPLLYLTFHSSGSVFEVLDHHVLFDESGVDFALELGHLALEHLYCRVLLKRSLLVLSIQLRKRALQLADLAVLFV